MDMQLVAAREELNAALTAFQGARTAIQDAGPTSNLKTLEARFTKAEQDYKTARADYSVAEASNFTRQVGRGHDARVTREDVTYHRRSPHSVFRDIYNAGRGDFEASQRLDKHKQEMRHERPDSARFDLSSTDAAGGYLVPPLYLQEEFIGLARSGAATLNAIGTRPLPPNTDSINLPRLATGVTVADQADNAAVSETDATLDTIAGAVKTIAGMQDVSRQVVDRSIPGVDQVIFTDLSNAFFSQLDSQVINSTTTDNKGLLQVTGLNSVTFTHATPTVALLYPKLADAIRQVHENVFAPPTAIFMHPRRWAWILASLDSQNRPLVTPYAPQNAAGGQGGVASQGLVGSMQGLEVYVDPNIPTTLGASTNEDRIIVARTPELFVYTAPDGPYLETFHDVGSGTLTVRFRLHSYWAQVHTRRPKALSVISGTGTAAPTF